MIRPDFTMLMAKFLRDNGYLKFSKYIWGKNVKTETATGNTVVVNLMSDTITRMELRDRFLFIRRPPRIVLVNTRFYTVSEFERYVMENERTQLEFFKKQKEWGEKHDVVR